MCRMCQNSEFRNVTPDGMSRYQLVSNDVCKYYSGTGKLGEAVCQGETKY